MLEPDDDLRGRKFTYEDIQELRRESARYRISAKETEAKRAEVAAELDALQAEHSVLTERLTATEKAAQERVIRAELKAAAIKGGMIDLDGIKLLDLSTVKLTEAGDVEGADAIVAKAKELKPYLFGAVTAPPAGNPPPAIGAKHAMEMTDAEFDAELGRVLAR